jgi:hypothetical protein
MEPTPHYSIHIHEDPFVGEMDLILQSRLNELLDAVARRDVRDVKRAALAIDSHTMNLRWYLDNE